MKVSRFLLWFFLGLFAGLPALSVFSCSTEGVLKDIIGTNAEAPVFLDCRPVSSKEMVFRFSRSVRVVSLFFNPVRAAEYVEKDDEISVTFTKALDAGMKLTADIIVKDSANNTLNVIVPFRARNDRMPQMIFNELRTEYSKPKVEFLEFKTLGAGNLGALRLFIAGHSLSNPAYEFPPTEVKAGEFIVLHLRTVEDGCVDETGQDLALSKGAEALDTARDFWVPGAAKLLHKTDALWLMDQDDKIIDAILLCEKPDAKWSSEAIAEAAKFIGLKKAWLPSSGDSKADGVGLEPKDAVLTAGTTNTRTICRDESLPRQNRAGSWYIAATSSATPGKPNSAKRYSL